MPSAASRTVITAVFMPVGDTELARTTAAQSLGASA